MFEWVRSIKNGIINEEAEIYPFTNEIVYVKIG